MKRKLDALVISPQTNEVKTVKKITDLFSNLQEKINQALIHCLKSKSTVPLAGIALGGYQFTVGMFAIGASLGGLSEADKKKILEFNAQQHLGIMCIINDIIKACIDDIPNYTPLSEVEKNKLGPLHKYFFPDNSGNWNAAMRFFARKSLKDERVEWIKEVLGEQFNEIKSLCNEYDQLTCFRNQYIQNVHSFFETAYPMPTEIAELVLGYTGVPSM